MNMADYCPQAASLILAQTDRMSTVSERFQSDGTDISATQIVVFVVLAMVIAGVVGWAAPGSLARWAELSESQATVS